MTDHNYKFDTLQVHAGHGKSSTSSQGTAGSCEYN